MITARYPPRRPGSCPATAIESLRASRTVRDNGTTTTARKDSAFGKHSPFRTQNGFKVAFVFG